MITNEMRVNGRNIRINNTSVRELKNLGFELIDEELVLTAYTKSKFNKAIILLDDLRFLWEAQGNFHQGMFIKTTVYDD